MSSDGKEAIAELKFSYTFDENNITTIYESFKGKDGEIVETTFIKPKMVSLVNSVSTQYPIFDYMVVAEMKLIQLLLKLQQNILINMEF
ncbi:hypothetical protein AN644_04985 [Candidatus Epulonipiscium fishelsonii]|nr:hypothetical protein AN644_04985 [Epulopiscium sp. SCG-C06WGA-EpuloA1]